MPQYLKKFADHDMSVNLFGVNGEDAEKSLNWELMESSFPITVEGTLMLPQSFDLVKRKKCRVSLFQNELKHL